MHISNLRILKLCIKSVHPGPNYWMITYVESCVLDCHEYIRSKRPGDVETYEDQKNEGVCEGRKCEEGSLLYIEMFQINKIKYIPANDGYLDRNSSQFIWFIPGHKIKIPRHEEY